MNKNKKQRGEEKKKKNSDESRERDEGAAPKETTGKARKKKERCHGATDWNNRGQEEATQRRGPKDWVFHNRATQWEAVKRTDPELDHPGTKEPASNRAARAGTCWS